MPRKRAPKQSDTVIVGGYRRISRASYAVLKAQLDKLAKATPEGDKSWLTKPPRNRRGMDKAKLSKQDIEDIKVAVQNGWSIVDLVAWYEVRGRKLGYNLLQRAARGKLDHQLAPE